MKVLYVLLCCLQDTAGFGSGSDVIFTRPISQLLQKLQDFESRLFSNLSSFPSSSPQVSVDQFSVGSGAPMQVLSLAIVVAGGGAAGIELAWAMRCGSSFLHCFWGLTRRNCRARYSKIATKVSICILSAADEFKPLGRFVRRNVQAKLDEFGMQLRKNVRCIGIERETAGTAQSQAVLSTGEKLKFDLLLVATGAAPPPCLLKFHVAKSDDGYISVKKSLQCRDFPTCFAAGDCVSVEGAPWIPKAGVYAVREGPIVAKNILALLSKQVVENYDPQDRFLSLLMTGDGSAISSWKGLSFCNSLVWNLKDKIDRQFMNRFDAQKLYSQQT